MRISDWSSDVCSSDLLVGGAAARQGDAQVVGVQQREALVVRLGAPRRGAEQARVGAGAEGDHECDRDHHRPAPADRKSVVWGKSVSVRVDLGGRRIINKQKHQSTQKNKKFYKS